jgi:hypothetical protein
VTNNCGFWIWWLDLLDISITVTLDCNSWHIELLLDNQSLTVVWILHWCLVSSRLEFCVALLSSRKHADPLPTRFSQSQSHIATEGQSVSKFWCRAPSGAHDQIFITVWLLRSCFLWSALSDERTGLSFVYALVYGSCQCSRSRARVPWYTRSYITVPDLRLPFSSPPTTPRVTMEVFDASSTRVTHFSQSQSQSHIATDGQSVSLGIDIYFCLTVTLLFPWGALSDERTGLSFVCAAGPCQRSLSRILVPWDLRPYFTVSDLRLPISSPPTTRRVTVEVFDPSSTRVPSLLSESESEFYVTIDGQSASLSWYKAPRFLFPYEIRNTSDSYVLDSVGRPLWPNIGHRVEQLSYPLSRKRHIRCAGNVCIRCCENSAYRAVGWQWTPGFGSYVPALRPCLPSVAQQPTVPAGCPGYVYQEAVTCAVDSHVTICSYQPTFLAPCRKLHGLIWVVFLIPKIKL